MKTFAEQNLVEMNFGDMDPAPYNPRHRLSPDSPEYDKLKASIEEFGNVQPIVVNKATGNIVGGHQRYWIMRDDLKRDSDKVVLLDIDERHERALNLALNTHAGSFDDELFRKFMADVERKDHEMNVHYAQSDWLGAMNDFHRLAQQDGQMALEMRLATSLSSPSPSSSATDFLIDQDISATLANKATVGGAELKEDHPHRTGEQFFTMQIVLTKEQRDTVAKAMLIAKELYELNTSMESLTMICQQFLVEQGKA